MHPLRQSGVMLQEANLWDVSIAPTIVMTQRGARSDFQRQLRARGVEVVEFDFLTPHAVAAYCYERGFLQCLWECGGTLAAPAIAAGVIHKTLAFIAPKLVGTSTCTCQDCASFRGTFRNLSSYAVLCMTCFIYGHRRAMSCLTDCILQLPDLIWR